MSTLPVYCPPSAECQARRLAGLSCDAQGIYEPIICESGYYCPSYNEKYECPKGMILCKFLFLL